MRKPVFQIKRSADKQFYFVLVAPNNEVIGTSEMYKQRGGCRTGIQSVITNALKHNFDVKRARNGQFYFNLIAGNGKVVLTSEMYVNLFGLGIGSDAVIKHCTQAEIVDTTKK
jgi:uncharacterized protein